MGPHPFSEAMGGASCRLSVPRFPPSHNHERQCSASLYLSVPACGYRDQPSQCPRGPAIFLSACLRAPPPTVSSLSWSLLLSRPQSQGALLEMVIYLDVASLAQRQHCHTYPSFSPDPNSAREPPSLRLATFEAQVCI